MPDLNTDKERLKEFKQKVSESLVEILGNEVSVGKLSNDVVSKIEEYDSCKDNLNLHFDDKKSEIGFREFNDAFSKFNELLDKMISHVFDKEGEKIIYYAILPRESRGRLIKQFSDLQDKYRKFVLEARRNLLKINKSEKRNYPLLKLPSGTTWKNFIIKFLDGKNILVVVQGIKAKFSFKDMGFENKKNGKPNVQWTLLYILAGKNGELSWKDSEASVKIKKRKEILTNTLQECFGLNDDPFKTYRGAKPWSYKTNFVLMPPENPNKDDDASEDEISKGVQEYLEDQQRLSSNHPENENNPLD